MGNYLATVTLQAANGDPKDDVQNTFAFSSAVAPAPGATLNFTDGIDDFYNLAGTGTWKLGEYIGSRQSRAAGGVIVRYYDVTGKLGMDPAKVSVKHPNGLPYNHGSPIASDTITLAAAASPYDFPGEVALVTTLRAANFAAQPVERADGSDANAASDRPRQRYSGRLYIGPLNRNSAPEIVGSGSSGQGEARPRSQLTTAIMDACDHLKASWSASGITWCVWSRTDGAMRAVTQVEVDNAFDTQRRRGGKSTARTAHIL